jgi:hypothetical protein
MEMEKAGATKMCHAHLIVQYHALYYISIAVICSTTYTTQHTTRRQTIFVHIENWKSKDYREIQMPRYIIIYYTNLVGTLEY